MDYKSISDSVCVYDYRYSEPNEKKGVQISWSALGSVSIKDTERFIKELQKAVKYAKRLIKNK